MAGKSKIQQNSVLNFLYNVTSSAIADHPKLLPCCTFKAVRMAVSTDLANKILEICQVDVGASQARIQQELKASNFTASVEQIAATLNTLVKSVSV